MSVTILSNHKGKSNIGSVLAHLFSEADEEIFIVAPYISNNHLIENFSSLKVKTIKILTKLSLHDFVTSASDIDMIKKFMQDRRIEVRYFSNLHAKVYLFDNKKAVITSANFTSNGFLHNLEYGVLTCEGIEVLSQDLLALWNRAEIVNENLVIQIMSELSVVDDKKEVATTVKSELSNLGNSFIKKRLSHRILPQKIQDTDQERKLLDEDTALNLVISHWGLNEENSEKMKLVYDLIKMNIPKEIRDHCSFRYRAREAKVDIACNIMNYRLFLFPYTKNNIVQLIYPREDLSNLTTIFSHNQKRLSNLEQWTFKNFDCDILFFSLDEILLLESTHWESFGIACTRTLNAKKTRSREGNIIVNWDNKNDVCFYISATRGAKAKGKLIKNGFLVLEGSIAAKEIAPSFPNTQYYEPRQKLLMDRIIIERDNQLVFTKDYLFNSPSEAASVVMGRNATGQRDWKLLDGTCLRDYLQRNKGI